MFSIEINCSSDLLIAMSFVSGKSQFYYNSVRQTNRVSDFNNYRKIIEPYNVNISLEAYISVPLPSVTVLIVSLG